MILSSTTTGLQNGAVQDQLRRFGLWAYRLDVPGRFGDEPGAGVAQSHNCGAEPIAKLRRFPVVPCARPAMGIHDVWGGALAGNRWQPYWVIDAQVVHSLAQIPTSYRDATIPEAVMALIYNSHLGSTRVRVEPGRTVQVYFGDGGLKIEAESDDQARRGLFGEEGPTHHLLCVSLDGVVH